MVRGDIHYVVVACTQFDSGEGDIHYGVEACMQLYSGEGIDILWCSSMYTILQW